MPTVPDWSAVEWYVYESPAGVRVFPRELSAGELRPREKYAATVIGVSRKTVLALLKAGVKPAELPRRVSEAAEAQHARSSADRRPNRYCEFLAAVAAKKAAEYESRKAA